MAADGQLGVGPKRRSLPRPKARKHRDERSLRPYRSARFGTAGRRAVHPPKGKSSAIAEVCEQRAAPTPRPHGITSWSSWLACGRRLWRQLRSRPRHALRGRTSIARPPLWRLFGGRRSVNPPRNDGRLDFSPGLVAECVPNGPTSWEDEVLSDKNHEGSGHV